jgi:multicomponent Na+:H+ antiporter subunit B
MRKKGESIIIQTAFRYAVPLIFLYAIYVLTHGEYSPGGGFQAGALLAMVVVLSRLVEGDKAEINITGNNSFILAGIGTFIFALTGWITMAFGGKFLDYSMLPIDVADKYRHQWGILTIEIGVTVCVMATIIVIFDAITRKGESDDN